MKSVRFNRHPYRRAGEKTFKIHDDFPLRIPPLKRNQDSTEYHEEDKE